MTMRVFKIWEVKFRRCLDRDRFLQCVAWVEGPDSKPFPHRLKKCAASETFVCLRSGL